MFVKAVAETPELLRQVLQFLHKNGQLLDYAPIAQDKNLYTQVLRVKGDFSKIDGALKKVFKKKVRLLK